MRIPRYAYGMLLPGILLRPVLLEAAEQAGAQAATGIHRTAADWAVILASLAVFWVVALGCAVTLWLRAREADRLFALEPGRVPAEEAAKRPRGRSGAASPKSG